MWVECDDDAVLKMRNKPSDNEHEKNQEKNSPTGHQ
jgi:hypothetical protein